MVLSNLYLHWSNNFFECLSEINRILKPDGLFLASLFGNETLKELKYSLYIAESKLTNKVVPSIPSFLNIQQTGSLLQNTGFNLPVVDKDIIKIFYKDIFDLMQDIKLMGGNNNFIGRKKIIGYSFFEDFKNISYPEVIQLSMFANSSVYDSYTLISFSGFILNIL